MANEKQPMDPIKKLKLVYTIELLIFAGLFGLFGCLFLFNVWSMADWKRIAFPYITLVGALWIIASFIWVMASPAKRAKSSLFDKCMLLPLALFLIGFDIYAFAANLVHIPEGTPTSPIFNYVVGGDFLYLALAYIIQAIYHYKHPIPALLDAIGMSGGNQEK